MQRGGYTSTKLHDGGIKHPETTEQGDEWSRRGLKAPWEVVFRGLMFGARGEVTV